METQAPIQLNDLLTIEQLADAHPNILKVATIKWQLRFRETNGLAAACVPVGRRLLISKTRYEAWLGSQAEAA